MNVAGYRLYYSDGSTAEDWETSPDGGVQVLVVFYDEQDKRGRPLRALYHGSPGNGADYYWQFGAGIARDTPKGAALKTGEMIEKADFMAIYNRALNDYQWP